MTFNPLVSQTNRIAARLQKLVGPATGKSLDKAMLEITGGKRYNLEIELMFLSVERYNRAQFELYNEIQSLLNSFRNGKDVASKLSSALTKFIKLQYPYSNIEYVIFNDVLRDWPCITVVFCNIVYAYNFGLRFDGGGIPREYSINDLMRSATFQYSLVPEFNRNRTAASRLVLNPS